MGPIHKKLSRFADHKDVTTRKVDDLVQTMGMTGISKSQVSRMCEELDDKVGTFLHRELTGTWPFPWLDATYLKVCEGGRVHNRVLVAAVGVNEQGVRQPLGCL